MKKFAFILFAVAGSMAFVGCSSDDDKGGDCFNCDAMGINTKFCKVGDSKYSVSVAGLPAQEFPLGDQTWEEFKDDTLATCN